LGRPRFSGGKPMNIQVAFGKQGLSLELPDGPDYHVVKVHSAPPLPDVEKALATALDDPIAGLPLQELARGKKTAAISVCDITRPAHNPITLPPLLERLHLAGIPPEKVTICIATGLHRGATEDELRTILGAEIAAKYDIANHDARDRKLHRFVGTTQQGTPVYIDERFMAADLHLTMGFIEQHLMLGFSGGRKLVAPGLAAQESIKVIHSPRFMREGRATEGSIRDNPLHAELLEVARMARHDFMLDVTLTKAREISGVFAGEPVAAHAAGVKFLRSSSVEYLPEPVDAVITSAAGYPLDLTFYQTIKGVTAGQHILKPGGTILILGECAEGVGSAEFAAMVQRYQGPQAFLDAIETAPVEVDQWQLEKLALVELKHDVLFYLPGIAPEDLGSLRSKAFDSASAAVAELISRLPENARVAVIPDGPYAYARVRE
ncbi:MAG TPA: nickel-dependent lactate racemase, partial [Acidobacteriaceae bacterium]|nr:nickel-dependent lactate racemase [Acidobacteriaceae bacterium]